MNIVELTIDQIGLDLENPRFEGLTNTREALISIVVDQGSKLIELATDIVSEGLSPAHQLLVIKSQTKDSYIVVDGNRRIAVLKLLINPSFFDSSDDISVSLKKQFKELSKNFNRKSIEPIRVSLLDSREEANRWIELIHTGENKGRGVVDWDGKATDRFRGRSPGLKILELLRNNASITEEAYSKFPITTLNRLLSTPEVRTAFGITIQDGAPMLLYPIESLLPLLTHVANELASGNTTVSNLKNKDQRLNFANSIPKKLIPSKSKALPSPIAIDKTTITTAKSKLQISGVRSKTSQTALRKNLIPSHAKCRLNISSPKLEEITKELRKLELDSTPHAIAVLFRVFIEISMDVYAKNMHILGYKADTDTLSKKVLSVATYLEQNGMTKNDLASFRRVADNKTSPLNVDRLHKFIHNTHALPTANELRTGWNEVQPIFEKIWN